MINIAHLCNYWIKYKQYFCKKTQLTKVHGLASVLLKRQVENKVQQNLLNIKYEERLTLNDKGLKSFILVYIVYFDIDIYINVHVYMFGSYIKCCYTHMIS